MATKKKSAKKGGGGLVKTQLDIGSDPPVLVGGGSSSLIWVNFNQNQMPVSPGSVSGPSPSTKSAYSVNRVTNGPVRLYFNDGTVPGPAGEVRLDIPVAGRQTWYIRFAVSGRIPRPKKSKR